MGIVRNGVNKLHKMNEGQCHNDCNDVFPLCKHRDFLLLDDHSEFPMAVVHAVYIRDTDKKLVFFFLFILLITGWFWKRNSFTSLSGYLNLIYHHNTSLP